MVGPAARNLGGDGRFAMPHSGAASQLAVGFRRSVPRRGTYGEMGGLLLPHSGAASQLAVGFGWSVPLRGTCREMEGLLIPTAALLRSLQWVSDDRSRFAEPRGRWEVCYTHSGAASQLAVGFGWSVPLCGTCGVRWEMAMSYVRCTVHV